MVAEKERAPLLMEISTSTAPSLSKSPSANPREDIGMAKNRAALCADVLEGFPSVVKQHERLFVSDLAVQRADEVIRIAVGEKQIQIPVNCHNQKIHTPATHEFCWPCDNP